MPCWAVLMASLNKSTVPPEECLTVQDTKEWQQSKTGSLKKNYSSSCCVGLFLTPESASRLCEVFRFAVVTLYLSVF